MFIKYQKVRNTVVGTVAAAGAGVAAIFGFGGGSEPAPNTNRPETAQLAAADQHESHSPVTKSNNVATSTPESHQPVLAEQDPTPPDRETLSTYKPDVRREPPADNKPTQPARKPTTAELYDMAIQLAMAKSDPSGKGKDVLGPASPWKLNLYDDNKDGQWDRGKLDTNRDEVDDEKWNFKQGRWEKDGGATLWLGGKWVSSSRAEPAHTPTGESPEMARYRSAMKIATSQADRSGKGKDVLGSSSPWKLNLYDDDKDGRWDRGKLDTNRDEVDDEKWNFKQGRWEKDGGAQVWRGEKWVSSQKTPVVATRSAPAVNAELARYRSAMKIATSRADRSGKGKDVLGPASPWKLNLYDDNKDGRWDRGKLDLNRDDIDDEKWNFKDGRWEKDGGSTIWKDDHWQPSE